ncbi:MAG: HD-GYP domain-containing protein [Actinomycetota bacterium]|nr:HD-GYP domain-containing protein [Actinomycetota bacterium]
MSESERVRAHAEREAAQPPPMPAAAPDQPIPETDTHEVHSLESLEAGDGGRRDPAVKPLFVLTQTLEERYSDLAHHGHSVAGYCALAARELGLGPDEIERVALAGELHDLGKVGVADEILRKPAPLSAEEWKQVMRHPQIGADLLVSSNLDDLAEWVVAHHERPDGSGYPHGADETAIPLEAKILAVADAYDAMRTDRVYKEAFTHEESARELRKCAGSQFDPVVVEAFLRGLDRIIAGREGREGRDG